MVGSQTSDSVVSYADVQAGDVSASYGLRSTAGGPVIDDQETGLSMQSLIQDDVGLPLAAVTFVEVSVGGSEPMTLSPADLGDPSDPGYPFPSGLLPAIFLGGPDSLGYIAPLRNDDQPNDFAQTTADGSVDVTVHTTGRLVTPTVSVDPAATDVGQAVTFSAAVPDAPATTLDYVWDFGDGPDTAGTASVSHTYTAAGTYGATVTVRGADGSLGISSPVTVTVGPVSTATTGTGRTGGKARSSAAPTRGPVSGSGSRSGGKTGSTPNASSAKNGDAGHGTTGKGTASSAAGATAAATPTPVASAAPTPTAASTPTATATPQPKVRHRDAEDRVSGILIDGSPTSAPTAAASGAQAASARATRASGAPGVGWAAGGIAGTLALLGVGAFAETGLLQSWHARRKRKTR